MKTPCLISWCLLALLGCKTAQDTAPAMPVHQTQQPQEPQGGAPTVGMAISFGGELWHADQYSLVQMGESWLVKGTSADNTIFSILLPTPLATAEYKIVKGGKVSITHTTGSGWRKGQAFYAPYSAEENGWVKTVLADGYLRGTLEVTITSGVGSKVLCKGSFSVKLE